MIGRTILFATIAVLASSCTYSVHMVHASGYEPYVKASQGRKIEASAERDVILFFNSDTRYVDRAYNALLGKCSGEVVGITTEFQTALKPFSFTQKIIIRGLCV